MPKKPKATPPPRELYIIVDAAGRDCVCVSDDIDRLRGQERLASDKVYRVVSVVEVEDPRDPL